MLDRIVTRQAQQVHVPDAIRENIFAQMSASMTPASHGAPNGGSALRSGNPGSGGGAGLAGRSIWKFGRGAMTLLMTACSFAAGYYVHSQFPDGGGASVSGTPPVQEVRHEAAPAVQAPAAQAPVGAASTDAVTGPAVTTAPEQSPTAARTVTPQPSRAVRQSAGPIVAPRPAARPASVAHGVSVTGPRHEDAADQAKQQNVTAPAATSQKPVSTVPDHQTDPLDPPTNAKPTVTSGAQNPSVSVDGVTRDSHGNPQRELHPQERP
jgi:hypothetical protein